MDDIYDDLDNYEDLNILEELKKENHDLKLKLEENTIAMIKLQKDFDTLSVEYKKLEMNYSSLLKTAKIEIERKTKIITDLNIEKDMIIINALKNRSFNDIRKLKSVTNTFTKTPSNDNSLGKTRSSVPLAENTKGKKYNNERKDDIRFSSVDSTTTSGNTEITSKLMQLANKNSENLGLWSDRTSDTKENMSQSTKHENNSKSLNTQALSIKNRRKSMPAVRSHTNFSSDEECEDRYFSNDNRRKTREDPNRGNVDKGFIDRHRFKGIEDRNKHSEMTKADDKYYGYPGPSRNSYRRSRNDRQYETDKYRNKNKYEVSLRHRRQSPDRSWRPRNDDYQRQGCDRVLESPPPDKFYYYQHRGQDMRFKRDRDDAHEFEKRNTDYDKYSSRHSDHYDEPVRKRLRRDSIHKLSEEELRCSRERPLDKPLLDLYENIHQDLSCQSPDYMVPDAVSHPVREIMNTASTPLEDPRVHSRQYILKTSDDNVELSTVTGRNVDLKLLDTTLWNITKPEVPKPLTRRPSQCSEDIVKEIYMDIDNPVSNMSTESGEVLSFDVEDNVNVERNTSNDNIQTCTQNIERAPEKLSHQNEHISSLIKYKIPKIKKNERDKVHVSHEENVGKVQNKTEQPVASTKNDQHSNETPEQNLEKINQINKEYRLETHHFKNKDSDNCALNYSESYGKPVASMKELIAGDLELSDETSDNFEVVKNAFIEKSQQDDHLNTNTEPTDKTIMPLQNKATDLQDIKLDKNIENETIQAKPIDIPQVESKSRSSKKRLSKSKETPKITKSDATDKEADKKNKSKKDSKDPKEIKTKFSELFGDSSSLITPEDLGFLAVQAQTQPSASYVPICEDAQDAVDITISNVSKAQTRLSKLKSMETVQRQESCETNNNGNKTDTKSKNLTKSSNETKKKTKKNSAQVTDKSKIREVYQSLTADKLVKEKDEKLPQKKTIVTTETVTDKIPDKSVSKLTETMIPREEEPCEMPKELVDQHTITAQNTEILQKPNILMRALATSTPQKEPQSHQLNPGIGIVVTEHESSCQSNSKEASCDNVAVLAASQSSKNETISSQNDDVPDVRIFVKRKRRVKILKPSVA